MKSLEQYINMYLYIPGQYNNVYIYIYLLYTVINIKLFMYIYILWDNMKYISS